MALGRRIMQGLIPPGLGTTPEEEEYLKRQLMLSMGTGLLGNAFRGGSMAGLMPAISEPLQQVPQSALAMYALRRQKEEEEQQRLSREQASELAMLRELRAGEAHDIALEDQDFQREDRESRLRTEGHDRSVAARERVEGMRAREKALQGAKAHLEQNADKLGPRAAAMQAMIDSMEMQTQSQMSPKMVGDWVRDFYTGSAEAETGERDYGFKVGQERRIAEGEPEKRELYIDQGEGGSVTAYDRNTGDVVWQKDASGNAAVDETKIPPHIHAKAYDQATKEVMGMKSTDVGKQTPAQTNAIRLRAWELMIEEMQGNEKSTGGYAIGGLGIPQYSSPGDLLGGVARPRNP